VDNNRARWSRNARPTREHVDGDAYDEDPRVVMPFNGMSPSGDAEAEVVYANYGTPEDFEKLEKLKIDVRGKIVLVRYGQNFRGVKEFIAQETWRGGSDHLLPIPTTTVGGVAINILPAMAAGYRRAARVGGIHVRVSRRSDHAGELHRCPSLPESKRISPDKICADAENPITPLSYQRCVAYFFKHLAGPDSPARMAGRAAFHVSRGARSGTRKDAPEAGLSVPHALGCDWARAWQRLAG